MKKKKEKFHYQGASQRVYKLPKDREYQKFALVDSDSGKINMIKMEYNKDSLVQNWLRRHGKLIETK